MNVVAHGPVLEPQNPQLHERHLLLVDTRLNLYPRLFPQSTMSLAATRMLLRRPQVGRMTLRHASTTSEAANAAASSAAKAKETAGAAASGASQGLSKVTSTAGSALSSAGNALNSIGGRTGRLIGFVQCT